MSFRTKFITLLISLAPLTAARADEPISQQVDVGGYKLTLASQGQGGPTVVIEAGMGLAAVESDEWAAVCEEIAKTNRICRYNRAGLGSSEAAPTQPRTSRDMAKDLHALLTKAKIPGPYVLVGHSIGGLNVRMFADMYPRDTAAVVLVDATHPDQETKWLEALGAKRAGEDPAVGKARDYIRARIAQSANNSEKLDVVASGAQVRAAGNLKATPLVVVTHSPNWQMVPGLPPAPTKQLERASQALQKSLTALSTNSKQFIAEKAGHAIHVEEPQLVIEAIREAINRIKPDDAG